MGRCCRIPRAPLRPRDHCVHQPAVLLLLTQVPVRRTLQPARFLRLCPISGVRAETPPLMRGEFRGTVRERCKRKLPSTSGAVLGLCGYGRPPARDVPIESLPSVDKIHGARESARRRVKEVRYSSLLGRTWRVFDGRNRRPPQVARTQRAQVLQRWMATPSRALSWAASSTWIARRASGRDTSGAALPRRASRQLA